jgi:hypothetical protein
MWQWIQSNFGIIILAISFGISGLGWLLKQLKEAQEKKRADQARQRARLEALRTGRIEGTPAPGTAAAGVRAAGRSADTPRKNLEELARRRQQEQQQRAATQRRELEEQLRRRREAIEAQRQRQQQQRQPAPSRPTQPTARAPQQVQRGGRPAGGQPGRRPSPPPVEAPRRAGERRPVAPLPTSRPIQQTVIADVIEAQRVKEEGVVVAPLPLPSVHARKPVLARGIDLRQAVIMREIFDKPVSMRDPLDQGW